MISKRVRLVSVAVAAGLAMTAAGCGEIGGSSGGSDDTLTIGFVSPITGPMAPFGEVNTFVEGQMKDYFEANPLTIEGKEYAVEIIVKDAASDSTKASAAANDLINSEGADLIIANGTPDITNPVSAQCEANSIPCITDVAPWQPFAFRDGSKPADLKYSFHFFWGLEDVSAVYANIWKQVVTNGKAGGLFPDDPDGQAWSENFPSLTADSGVTISDPGLFPNGTKDFTAQISKFKAEDDQVLVGVPIPPDFTTFWKQAAQQGYKPKVATIGKALLFPSSVEALGDIAQNLATEVWWTPTAPYTSSLTGLTAQQLSDAYTRDTGKPWTQPLGYAEALFEVAIAAVQQAGSTDADEIVGALKSLDVNTVVGEVHFGADKNLPPYIAKTPVAGGQWRKIDGAWQLVVVENSLAPQVPLGGKPEPIS